MTPAGRVAGAPISWGVCEVPGWGHQMAPERVLAEMRDLGLVATEFGPPGFLPDGPRELVDLLARYGMAGLGGFLLVQLHRPEYDPLPVFRETLAAFTAAGATTVVLAADTGLAGYDRRPELDAAGWNTLLTNLDRLTGAAAEAGLTVALHPHVGTLVEREDEVVRVLGGCAAPLCLDTGHLMVGGANPLELASRAPERIAHVHLKDVDAAMAGQVRHGARSYTDAVRAGMYRPLGRGDVDVAGIVAALERHGYRGVYVLEQDTVLTAEPDPGAGPVLDVAASLDFIRDALRGDVLRGNAVRGDSTRGAE